MLVVLATWKGVTRPAPNVIGKKNFRKYLYRSFLSTRHVELSISRRKSLSIPILALGNKTVAVHWHCWQNDEYIELKYIVNCFSDYHGVLLGRLYRDGRWCQVWRVRRPDGLGDDPGHHCMHCGHSNIRHLQNRGNLNC